MTCSPKIINADEVIAEMLPFGEAAEERARRHKVFWGRLDTRHKDAARVACDFFTIANDVNHRIFLMGHYRDIDPDKSIEAFNGAIAYAKIAVAKLRLFAQLLGCSDAAEIADRLDRLIAHSKACDWRIYPDWWTKLPHKNTAYFIGQLRIWAHKEPTTAEEENKKAKGGVA